MIWIIYIFLICYKVWVLSFYSNELYHLYVIFMWHNQKDCFFKEQLHKSLCSSQRISHCLFLFLVTAFFLFMIKPKSFNFALLKLKYETLPLISILYKLFFKSFFNLQYHRFSYVFVLLLTNKFYLTFNVNR